MLVAVALHIWSAWRLTLMNNAARPVGYRETERRESTYASRTMRWSGVILLLFIVYHLLHFTIGVHAVHPQFVHGDAYHNFVTGFQNPLVSGFYILAMLALGLHLYHGAWSFMQTLGLSHPRYNHLRYALRGSHHHRGPGRQHLVPGRGAHRLRARAGGLRGRARPQQAGGRR